MSRNKKRFTKGKTSDDTPSSPAPSGSPESFHPDRGATFPFLSLLNALPCAVLVLDRELRILQANNAAQTMLLELSGTGPVDQNAGTRLPKAVINQFLCSILFAPLHECCTAALASQTPVPFNQVAAVTPLRGRLYISGCATPLSDPGGLDGLLLTAWDVTNSVLDQEHGRVLSRFTDEAPQAIIIVSADGRVVHANKASAALLGEMGCRVGELLPESFREWVGGSFATGQSCKMELTEKETVYNVTLVPLHDCGYAILYGLDVSWCTHSAELLKVKNRILNTSQNAIAMADADGIVTYVNPAFLRMWGCAAREEVLGCPMQEFWQSSQTIRSVVRSLLKDGEWSGELVARRKDGTAFRVQVMASRMLDQRTGTVSLVGTFVDITEQEAALEALRGSEYRYHNLMEVTSDWIWEINSRGVYIHVNPQVENVLGYEPGEVLERTPWDLAPPEEAEGIAQFFKHHLGFRIPFRLREFVFQHKAGHRVIVESSAVPVVNPMGQYCGLMGIDRDITRRKLAQNALKREHALLESKVSQRTRELLDAYELLEKSEAYHRAVLEEQTELICRFRPDGTLTYVNESYCRYFGKTRTELVGSYFKPSIPDQDRMACELHFVSLTPESPVGTLEHRIILPDGKVRWQQWVDRAIFNEHNELVECQSVGRDITDRVLAEQAFRQASEEREALRRNLEAVFQSISDAIVTVDRDMRIIRCNSALFSPLHQSRGYDPGGAA